MIDYICRIVQQVAIKDLLYFLKAMNISPYIFKGVFALGYIAKVFGNCIIPSTAMYKRMCNGTRYFIDPLLLSY